MGPRCSTTSLYQEAKHVEQAVGNAAMLNQKHYHEHIVVARDLVGKGAFMDRASRGKEEGELEDHLRQITLDLERTFPGMYFFSKNGPFHQDLREVFGDWCGLNGVTLTVKVLFAFSATRPDLGYVQVLLLDSSARSYN